MGRRDVMAELGGNATTMLLRRRVVKRRQASLLGRGACHRIPFFPPLQRRQRLPGVFCFLFLSYALVLLWSLTFIRGCAVGCCDALRIRKLIHLLLPIDALTGRSLFSTPTHICIDFSNKQFELLIAQPRFIT